VTPHRVANCHDVTIPAVASQAISPIAKSLLSPTAPPPSYVEVICLRVRIVWLQRLVNWCSQNTTMRDLPLSLLRSLAAVRSEGGVRPAARRLSVEHSAVSRALRDLERWVGVPIVVTQSRGQHLRLTPQGADLADTALSALREIERAAAKLREAHSATRVIIAAPPSVANRWLLPRLSRIEAECGGVEVSIIVDAIRTGELDPYADLCLRMGARPSASEKIYSIGSDVAFPVLGTNAWSALGRPNNIDALRSTPLLHDRDVRTAWSEWRDKIGPKDLNVAQGPRFTSADLVLRAAEQGRGWALTRGWLAQEALHDGHLVRPFDKLCLPLSDEWWVAENVTAPTRTPARKVLDWLIERAKDWLLH
jgi:LysR family transcriptional regulator, glycine cleavage system transcriptional activator